MSIDGPTPAIEVEENKKQKGKFWDRLAAIVKASPKGRAYDEKGNFYPDPTPVAPPIGYVQEPSMFDRVREMIRRDASMRAQAEGFETFEEADDFDVYDEVEPFSPYELVLEQAYPDGPTVNGETAGSGSDDGDGSEPTPSSGVSKSVQEPQAPSGSEPAAAPAGSKASKPR